MTAWALIIDDDNDNRELLAQFLELAGYPTVACGSAAEADKILDVRGKPGVVLSDVRLPDMYGPTFVDRMKCRPGFQDTPVIFVTGVQRSTLGGIADPVLIKPFDPEVLMGLVSQHCVPIEPSTGQLD